MLDELKSELKRTGLSLRDLASLILSDDRSMLPPSTLKAMLSGCAIHEVCNDASLLIQYLQGVPNASSGFEQGRHRFKSGRRIEVTDEIRASLLELMTDERISLLSLSRILFPKQAPNYLGNLVRRLMQKQQGTIDADVWEQLRRYLNDFEKIELPKVSPPISKPPFTEKHTVPEMPVSAKRPSTLADDYHQEVRPDKQRSQLSPPKPRSKIESYQLPERQRNMGYVIVDVETYERLHAERRRTCVSLRRLIKSAEDAPPDLRVSTAQSWLNGRTLSAEKRLLDWLIEAYAALPDAPAEE